MEEKLSGQGQEPLIKTSAVCSVREDWTVNSSGRYLNIFIYLYIYLSSLY